MRIRLLAALFALMVWSSQAQDIRGMISGTVTDPGGAIVPGATVTVTNTETNVSTPLTTNASGFYEAPLLPGGQYQVTVEAPGFKKVVRSEPDSHDERQDQDRYQAGSRRIERIGHHHRRISDSRYQHREHR